MYSGNILILTNWSYKDALIQTYTLPYVNMIRSSLGSSNHIILRTLEQKKYAVTIDEAKTIRNGLKEKNIDWFISKYSKSAVIALAYYFIDLVRLIILCLRHNIKVIHLWCTPPSIIAYPLSIITGAEIVIDSYEPHAEAMVENGDWSRSGFKFKVLFSFEKLVSRKAKVFISATEGMRNYAFLKYGITPHEFYVKPACVDLEKFSFGAKKNIHLLEELGLRDKLVGLYVGKFGGIYLDDDFFDFVNALFSFYKEDFRMLILTVHSREEIEQRCDKAGIDPKLVISRFVPHVDIPLYMGLADFAITPVKSVPSKRYCTPIKNGEYWALGLPVITTPNISDDSEIIAYNKIGVVLKEWNNEGYLKAILELDSLLNQYSSKELYDKIHYIAIKYRSFHIAEGIYKKIYG